MDRRELLGLMSAAVLSPRFGAELHARVAAVGAVAQALSPAQMELVTALADTILPRTDTPGAVQVGVPKFIDLLVAEWYDDADKAALLAGIDALDARCLAATGKGFAALDDAGRTAFLTPVDEARGETGSPEAAYRTLKQAIIYGWQTSQPIASLNPTPIIPGRFDGCIPLRTGS